MKKIKVAAPAKINLTLEVLNKRSDGFHNIKSIMQAIDLYDYLSFEILETNSSKNSIYLSGNSDKIPYNEKNLVYKAIEKFLLKSKISGVSINVYIEKNIPVEAGLAGGSTDASATFFALNLLFDNKFSKNEIQELCASLGSDLNFCLTGGRAICTGRGEVITPIETTPLKLSLIKPKNFGISAKEAYTKFSCLPDELKVDFKYTEKMQKSFDEAFLYNSLQHAVFNDYVELQEIKTKLPKSVMSGSGPTFFLLEEKIPCTFDNNRFLLIEALNAISDGVKVVC